MAIEQRELSVSISELIPWMEAHPATTGAIVAFVVVILGWFSGLFKWMWTRVFGGKDRRSESDPQALTKALHRYEELIETKDTLREAEEKVKDLSAALELTQSIARGGGELAQKAQALLDVFVAQPDDPTLPAQFDGLIDDYENGPVNDLIALYLGRGAVNYMNDPRGALAAYTRVTQLNPDHKAAHNQCGNLHRRLGDLTAAQAAYDTVLTLAEAEKDDEFKAKAFGNLGLLAKIRGDLAAAEGYYEQALTLNQALRLKEGMATNFGNLGGLEHARGNMAGARAFWGQARDLYAEIGMPHKVEIVQEALDHSDH
jgi:tetratricopeptide (TPR) repeat protein